MKYVLIIGDGIADAPIPALGGQTPLSSLSLPGMAALAGQTVGLVRTVPEGINPGSDTAILSIFGNDPRKCYTGRAALEAAGSMVDLLPGEVAFRVNLTAIEGETFDTATMRSHNGGNIEGDKAEALMHALMEDSTFRALAQEAGFTIHPTRTFRHIGVLAQAAGGMFTLMEPHNILGEPIAQYLPRGAHMELLTALMRTSHACLQNHPVNAARAAQGKLRANCIWPWAAGDAMALPSFAERYGHTGPVVSAVPLMWGIARMMGLPAPRVEGATGDLDTNYAGKVDAVLDGLRDGADFAAIHIEAPDECAHAKDVEAKREAIRRLDEQVVRPLTERLADVDKDFRILLLSDHPTITLTGAHDGAPVPFLLYDSRVPSAPAPFHEASAAQGIYIDEGTRLMDLLFENEPTKAGQ